MPSAAFTRWDIARRAALDEVEFAHRIVDDPKLSRPDAATRIIHAYMILLSSQFPGYCRDLHSEGIVIPDDLSRQWRTMIQTSLRRNRKLDTGNPNPGNIGSDFGRFDVGFWNEVEKLDPLNEAHKNSLDRLSTWRNAIAHEFFDDTKLKPSALDLGIVRSWRDACHSLAGAFDEVIANRIRTVTGRNPW